MGKRVKMKLYYENTEDYDGYIKSKALTIDSVEKIVSFLTDEEYCREGLRFKREVVRHVYGEKFSEIWPLVLEELKGE